MWASLVGVCVGRCVQHRLASQRCPGRCECGGAAVQHGLAPNCQYTYINRSMIKSPFGMYDSITHLLKGSVSENMLSDKKRGTARIGHNQHSFSLKMSDCVVPDGCAEDASDAATGRCGAWISKMRTIKIARQLICACHWWTSIQEHASRANLPRQIKQQQFINQKTNKNNKNCTEIRVTTRQLNNQSPLRIEQIQRGFIQCGRIYNVHAAYRH